MTRKEFIQTLLPHVQKVRAEGSKMFPSVRLAQNILETGGKIHDYFNLGGIKVGSGKPNAYWKGKVVNKGTWEVYDGKKVDIVAAFRAYDSLYDFYKDQDILFENARYKEVREAKTPEDQAVALYKCGYATDPQYFKKLIDIIKAEGLKIYDVLPKPAPDLVFDALKIIAAEKIVDDPIYWHDCATGKKVVSKENLASLLKNVGRAVTRLKKG